MAQRKGVISMKLRIKRIYDPPEESDGTRVLIDRLWPRGLSKERAAVDLWLKEIAPSDELRKWFHQHAEEWDEFRNRYSSELDEHPEEVAALRDVFRNGAGTLLFAAADVEHNNAVVLADYLRRP